MAMLPDHSLTTPAQVTKEIAVGELRLVRGWSHEIHSAFRSSDLALQSHYIDYHWTPGTNTAFHRGWDNPREHKAPMPGCACGLYGVFSYENIPVSDIVGVVEYWGRVRMGHLGIRAEYARIVALGPGARQDYRYGLFSRTNRRHFREIGEHYEAEVFYTQRDLIKATAGSMSTPQEFKITGPSGDGHDYG